MQCNKKKQVNGKKKGVPFVAQRFANQTRIHEDLGLIPGPPRWVKGAGVAASYMNPLRHAAWNPLHSIRMLWAMLDNIHCIQSGYIGPRFMDSSAYSRDPLHQNAWNTLHSMTLHGIHCIQSGCFGPCLIKSTSFNDAAWNQLHSIMLHIIHCLQ